MSSDFKKQMDEARNEYRARVTNIKMEYVATHAKYEVGQRVWSIIDDAWSIVHSVRPSADFEANLYGRLGVSYYIQLLTARGYPRQGLGGSRHREEEQLRE